MDTNKEAIYDTRPWKKFGEGPVAESDIPLNAQGFNEGSYSNMTGKEIRFTTKGKNLYAIILAWPEEGKVNRKIKRVELLGYGKLPFRQTANGVAVKLPANHSNHTVPVLKIR